MRFAPPPAADDRERSPGPSGRSGLLCRAALDRGSGAMLRAAARGCGQTLVARTAFDPDAHPRLGTRSFDPPLLHDSVVIWTAESEREAIHDLGASFAW